MSFEPALPWSGTQGGTIHLAQPITQEQFLAGALRMTIVAGGEETFTATFDATQPTYITIAADGQVVWLVDKWQGETSELVLRNASDDQQFNAFQLTSIERVVVVMPGSLGYVSYQGADCLAVKMSDNSVRLLKDNDGFAVVSNGNIGEFEFNPTPLFSDSLTPEPPAVVDFVFSVPPPRVTAPSDALPYHPEYNGWSLEEGDTEPNFSINIIVGGVNAVREGSIVKGDISPMRLSEILV